MVALCAATPDWTATADLMLHEVGAAGARADDPGEQPHPRRLTVDRRRASTSTTATALADLDELADPIEQRTRRHRSGDVRRACRRRRRPRRSSWDPLGGHRRASPHRADRRACRPSRCSSACGLQVVDAAEGVVELGELAVRRTTAGAASTAACSAWCSRARPKPRCPGYVGQRPAHPLPRRARAPGRSARTRSWCARPTTTWCAASRRSTPAPTTCVVALGHRHPAALLTAPFFRP